MRRLVYAALLIVLLGSVVSVPQAVHAQVNPRVQVTSQYTLNRYGYALVNETVKFSNNGTAAVSVPDFTIGLGNLSSKVVSYDLTGSGFELGTATDGLYTVLGGQSLAPGSSTTFVLKTLLNGEVTKASNGSLEVQVLIRPSMNLTVSSLSESVIMPAYTQFGKAPTGLTAATTGNITTYSANATNFEAPTAVTQLKAVDQAAAQDFHPLVVYLAERTIAVGSNLEPVVTDKILFENLGTTNLTYLYVSPLISASGKVTVIPQAVPHLLNPASNLLLGDDAIDLASSEAVGYSLSPNVNFTIVYQYPLPQKYFNSSGGQITLDLPAAAPIAAFINSYVVQFSLPVGFKVIQGPPPVSTDVEPVSWHAGSFTMSYGISVGWALGDGIPTASGIFALVLIGLFVTRSTLTEEEETEEESSTERASAMIKAFDDKTSLINGTWPEVAAADPNELNKAYFDEVRGRLDTFRNRALQRLNEVKQKSTTQKFFDLLNQIHTTEREVDKASRDKLNLYEQYYTRRMRKEVFDRLLPQYTKRLEKALNELSDELHVVQREAKLL